MITINSVEIVEYRAELAGNPLALEALTMIEDCEGDIEDAAIALALQVGQEPDRSDDWLDGFVKRSRHLICTAERKEQLDSASIADVIRILEDATTIPPLLLTPTAIYLLKTGLDTFCRPFEETF
jgi:hypothetical protein